MESKFISGSHSLEQIEATIRYEEAAFRKCTGSAISKQGSHNGNVVAFEPVSLPAGRLKLQPAVNKAPSGHVEAWSARMLVEGSPRQIVAWRAKEDLRAASVSRKSQTALLEAAALADLRPHAEASRYSVKGALLHGPDGNPVKQLASPNLSRGNSKKYLIIHYTAGTTLEGAVSWFLNAAAKASAHFVIARDGSVVQMVPLSHRAWHAGVSEWQGISGINAHSIGIEIVNGGKLHRTARGWVTWAERVVPEEEVTIATHKNESTEAGWHEYTAAQIESVLEISVALDSLFGFEDVLGHDDISPGRKVDPGPLFPLESVRSRVLGRR